MPAKPSQIFHGGKIATATAGERGIASVLWLVLAGPIVDAWIFLFEASWLAVPAGGGANFCPRPVAQGGLVTDELRLRELAALLVSVKSDLTTRIPCPTSQS